MCRDVDVDVYGDAYIYLVKTYSYILLQMVQSDWLR